MAMKERYYTIDGQMIGYKDAGGRKDFLTDALGSVTAEVDQTGATKAFDGRYKPYGGDLSSTGTRGSYGWVGSWGYRGTGLSASSHYVRARHYSNSSGNWTTVDPIWPNERALSYIKGKVILGIDYLGLQFDDKNDRADCLHCAKSMHKWFDTIAHHCNHQYTHCMACCLLTKIASPDCARGAQYTQNVGDIWSKGVRGGGIYFMPGIPEMDIWRYRDGWCASGINIGMQPKKPGQDNQQACSEGCSNRYGDVPKPKPKPGAPLTECEQWKKDHPKGDPKLPYLVDCDPDMSDRNRCRVPFRS
jgi:RHS repeat-associated protein